jgi:hypothetical protein
MSFAGRTVDAPLPKGPWSLAPFFCAGGGEEEARRCLRPTVEVFAKPSDAFSGRVTSPCAGPDSVYRASRTGEISLSCPEVAMWEVILWAADRLSGRRGDFPQSRGGLGQDGVNHPIKSLYARSGESVGSEAMFN